MAKRRGTAIGSAAGTAEGARAPAGDRLAVTADLARAVRWIATWTIHHANHIRPTRDGLKVGGHQASSASSVEILSALYFLELTRHDRVAVKPHASPAYHAIQYLLGRQSREQLERFRAMGGAQSYPSRTKDRDDVDFSTGSVGLGGAVTAFASMAQDYLLAKGWLKPQETGRMIALMGDAEFDEGNLYETMLEGAKYGLRNCWWIIDYNRQSLDAIAGPMMSGRLAELFAATDWDVHILKYGHALEEAFALPGGEHLRRWIDNCPNDLYSALAFEGGAAFRAQILSDIGSKRGVKALLARYDDEALHHLMTNLAGHDLAALAEAFAAARGRERPQAFIVYTLKGYGLPLQGHKDNHAGLLTAAQIAELRQALGIAEGAEWEPLAAVPADRRPAAEAFLRSHPFYRLPARRHRAPALPLPERIAAPAAETISTQAAFGRIMQELARTSSAEAERIVTFSPDVATSTNLGGWISRRKVFARAPHPDTFQQRRIPSPTRWDQGPDGQHIELGIAENNLFLALAAFGIADSLFGTRLIPIGTVYDPFIYRGLDALNYACYMGARFILVATPSGITLAPEGGAHQSIGTPLVGMAQPGLVAFEPAFADELAVIFRHALRQVADDGGEAVYLRLSTRPVRQPARSLSPAEEEAVLAGGYWRRAPGPDTRLAIAYCGAVAPEAEAAADLLAEDLPDVALLAVTSPDRLFRDWQQRRRRRAEDPATADGPAHVEDLLAALPPGAGLVTVVDAAPATLSWLGAVDGRPVIPLGVTAFGQSGDIPDLYHRHGLDADAILDAAALLLARR
ncbi:MAG: pyruvate dehydrogenase E1 component [Rhodothalassiaceae bacterium]|nr:MAG: pyruvate dehydrogenase E1 component [Rhodothalassiaceae bacterium]